MDEICKLIEKIQRHLWGGSRNYSITLVFVPAVQSWLASTSSPSGAGTEYRSALGETTEAACQALLDEVWKELADRVNADRAVFGEIQDAMLELEIRRQKAVQKDKEAAEWSEEMQSFRDVRRQIAASLKKDGEE